MDKPQHIPLVGTVPSLTVDVMNTPDNSPDLMVKSFAPYRRFAVTIADDGLDSYGLQVGDFAVFREQRWPNNECQICPVTFGDDASIRMIEYISNPTVTLRVAGEKIPALELAPTDFCVIGVLEASSKTNLHV